MGDRLPGARNGHCVFREATPAAGFSSGVRRARTDARESEILLRLPPVQTDASDCVRPPEFLFGDDQVAGKTAKN